MEQTPQCRDKKENPPEANASKTPLKNPEQQDAPTEEHVVPSRKKFDISDEDRALDSGI